MSADEEDVLAVLAGDLERFEGIVHRWQRPLLNLAYRFVRDDGLAEELAQEAFLKCYRSLGQWRREAAFSTWLFTVALSVYRSRLRKLEPLREAIELLDRATSPSNNEDFDARHRAESVRKAVARLPLLYREPLLLFYFQEHDLASTARLLGLREGTLKSRLHRGREALRRMLQETL